MEIVSTKKLQELANMLYEESNVSLRNKLSEWANAKAYDPEQSPLSALGVLAAQSDIKVKIDNWIKSITNQDSEIPYPDFIPDVPAQMEKTSKQSPLNVNEAAGNEEEVITIGRTPTELYSPNCTEEIAEPEKRDITLPEARDMGIIEETIQDYKHPAKNNKKV